MKSFRGGIPRSETGVSMAWGECSDSGASLENQGLCP